MKSCINFNNSDFKQFAHTINCSPSSAAYFVNLICDRLGLQEMPDVDTLLMHYRSMENAKSDVYNADDYIKISEIYDSYKKGFFKSLTSEEVDTLFDSLAVLGYNGIYKYTDNNGKKSIMMVEPHLYNSEDSVYSHFNFSVYEGEISVEEAFAANHFINANSPINRELANDIFKTCKKLGIKYILDPNMHKSGTFSKDTIRINPNRLNYRTIMHESIHAVTTYYLSLSSNQLAKQPKYIQESVQQIKNLHKDLYDYWINTQDPEKVDLITSLDEEAYKKYLYDNGVYFLHSPDELIAELSYENTKDFVDRYDKSNQTTVENSNKNKKWYDAILDFIFKLFNRDGINTKSSKNNDTNNYKKLYNSLETIVTNYNDSVFNDHLSDRNINDLPSSDIKLTNEQQNVVNAVSNYIKNPGPSRMITISGQAGTGKTTIVNSILEQIKGNNYRVGVAALSNKALNVLKSKITDKGIEYNTLYKMMGAKANQSAVQFDVDPKANLFGKLDAVFIDEASMVNVDTLQKIKSYCAQYGTVCVFLGDYGQISPIEGNDTGIGFTLPSKSSVFDNRSTDNILTLTQRLRQGEDNPILKYSDYFYDISVGKSKNSPNDVVKDYTKITDKGAIITTSNSPNIEKSIIEIFKDAKDNSNTHNIRIVAATNRVVDNWNEKIHDALFPGNKDKYAVGDIITMQAPWQGGDFRDPGDIVDNSEDLIITDIDTEIREIPSPVSDNPERFRIKSIALTCKVVSTGKTTVLLVPATKEEAEKHKAGVKELKAQAAKMPKQEAKRAWVAAYGYESSLAAIKLGYAITSHKAQGSTYETTIVDSDDILYSGKWDNVERSEMMYTAITRSSNMTVVLNHNSSEYSGNSFRNINNNIKARSNIRVYSEPNNIDYKNAKQQGTLSTTPAKSIDKKAIAKGSISNKFIGFADGIYGSSTAEYARQAKDKANVGTYSPNDVVFVSIPGMRGNAEIRHREQQKTIEESLKALRQGATLITDNEEYTNNSSYNEGEKKLAQALKSAGAIYSERVVNGHTLGEWKLRQSPNIEELRDTAAADQQEIEKFNEKPEPIIPPEITPLIETDGSFNIDEDDTEKSLSEKLTYALNSRTIELGNIIDVTSVKDPNLMAKLIKFLNKQTDHYIYRYDDGIEVFNSLPEEVKAILKDNKITRIPKYTYLFTKQELDIRKEEENIINSKLFKPSELAEYSRSAVVFFSSVLNDLKTSPEANEAFFGDEFKDVSFIDNTTEEILNKVGLDHILEVVLKEDFLNPASNDIYSRDDSIKDKLQLVYNNFRGFINLSYDQFLNLEGISIVDTSYNHITNTTTNEREQGEYDENDTDIQYIAEEYGSALEHWQVGFRSVSVHKSMSQKLRSYLNTLLDFNKEGLAEYNELGIPKTIDPKSAVDTMLELVQGSESLNRKDSRGNYEKTSMVYKLRQHIKTYPYLRQLVEEYHPYGDAEAPLIKGLLIDDSAETEQLQSLFYTVMQRNNQLYNILYKNGSTTKLKELNRSTYEKVLIDNLKNAISNKESNTLRLYDFENKKWKTEEAGDAKEIARNLYLNLEKNPFIGPSEVSKIKELLSLINVDTPDINVLHSLISNNTTYNIRKIINSIFHILNNVYKESSKENYDLLNDSNESNYKEIAEWLSPVMSTEIESMFYQNGKSYYSYVLPSYINKTVKKLRGETANWRKYMDDNYGTVGWFRTEDRKYLNYWLEEIEKDDDLRSNLEHSVLLSDYGIEYGDKSPAEYMASMIASYFYNDSSKYALFRVGLLSNKPSEEYIKFKKISGEYYDKTIINILAKYTFQQEINRILAVKERKRLAARGDELERKYYNGTITEEEQEEWDNTNHFTSRNLIENLDTNGDKFHFLEFLNEDIEKNTELGKKIKDLLKGLSSTEDLANMNNLLKTRISESLEEKYNEAKKAWVDNLVFSVDENNNYKSTDVPTLKNLVLKNGEKLNENKLREFFYNDYFAQINMTQLLITDLALYKDTEDLQKRLAQLHAPSMKPNTEATINGDRVSDGIFRTVYIKDSIIESKSVKKELKEAINNILSQLGKDISPNSTKYKQIKARLDNILDAFNKINWADAQGYTSPTAYRKRMALYGKWTEREENAYQQLKKGNISVENLDILWQPLKPFGFSQIHVDGHNEFMPKLKIGIQNKNSEYLLIMADALLKGGKQNSKLSAIMDVMEESYNLDSTKGIDAIQFESTVKTGKRSVIDINNLDTYDEVKQAFNEAIYINGTYNPENVQEYEFDDYGIQTEVPAHFSGEQQHGSQVRILAISDIACKDESGNDRMIIVNGEEMSVKEAKEDYMQAIADNINESVEDIARMFKLGYSKIEKNKAISDLLRHEIMCDSKYDPDLLWACSLNDKGEFNIPLSDPIHSVQVQQLLNSIIKNRIWKQKIAGGPVVQVSSFGLSKDLEIEWNDNGTIKCFQAYVPIYDEAIIKDFADEEGNIDIEKMRKNNPKLLEMFGYRIPTESKYSMVPIKVVGFLPRNAGEGIMLPAEITKLSGSDFDIDKLYIMRYEFDREVDTEEVGILKTTIKSDIGEEIRSSDIFDYYLGNEEIIQNEEIKNLLNHFKYKAIKYSEPKNTRAKNNNKIIDYSLAFLTSKYAQEQFITPGNFDEPKTLGYKIAAVKNGNVSYHDLDGHTIDKLKEAAYTKSSLLYSHVQMNFYKQNSVAAKLIGVFAQSNISHAFINTTSDLKEKPTKIFIGYIDKDGNVLPGSGFSINGHTFEGWQPLDPEYELSGINRVSTYLASLLAASVDAVKDPVLNLMNINMDTVNVLVTLLRLGVDLETSALFLSHPTIVKLVTEGGMSDGGILLDKKIEALSKYKNKSINITKDFLAEELSRDHEKGAALSDLNSRDYAVLSTLQKIIETSKDVSKVVTATRYNSINAGVGPYATDTLVQYIKTLDFISSGNLSESIVNILSTDAEYNNPILSSIYNGANSSVNGVFADNFLQHSDFMLSALFRLKDTLGYLNSSVAKKFSDFIISANQIASENTRIFNPSDDNRDYILNKFPTEFMNLKNEYLKNKYNLLLDSIRMTTDNYDTTTLTLNTRGMSNDHIKELQNSWYELWEDEKGHDLAFKLIEYNFFKGGFTYSPKTFIHLLPNRIKTELPHYIENLKSSSLGQEVSENLVEQFIVLNNLVRYEVNTEEDIKIEQLNLGEHEFKIAKFGNSYIKITPSNVIELPNLGGDSQAFEVDPNKAIEGMVSVVKKAEPAIVGYPKGEVVYNSISPKVPTDYIAKLLGEGYNTNRGSILYRIQKRLATRQSILEGSGLTNAQLDSLQAAVRRMIADPTTNINNVLGQFKEIIEKLNLCK